MTGRMPLSFDSVPDNAQAVFERLCPPEPQLLDTCVLQNLDWVDRQCEQSGAVVWDDQAIGELQRRYGPDLAVDLLDLGTLYKEFEARGGYPWLVCRTSIDEASQFLGGRGPRLRQLITFLTGHQDEWSDDSYPGIAKGLLSGSRPSRVSPLILKGLGVTSKEAIYSADGPLAFLPDEGDRMIAAYALVANIPVIMTTDLTTFWKHRRSLTALGVEVMRPSELLPLYESFWAALDSERAETRTPHV